MKQESFQKSVVVVLGMHRSGTSLTTRALQVLSVDLGNHLIPAIDGDNNKGFWEDIDINDFDNALLEKIGSAWDHLTPLDEKLQSNILTADRKAAEKLLEGKTKSTKIFGFKDPRTTILLPFWQTVFQNLNLEDRYVIAIRNPLNVATSLLERNNLPLEAGVMLWAKHMCGVLQQTQGKPRVVVDYNLMLESPSHQVKRISNNLSLPFDESSEERLSPFESEFVSLGLRHHDASLKDLNDSDLVPLFVKEAYVWLLRLASDEIEFDDADLKAFWAQLEEDVRTHNMGYEYIDRLYLSIQESKGENNTLSEALLAKEQSHHAVEKERNIVKEEIESIRQQLHQTSDELVESKRIYDDSQAVLKKTVNSLEAVSAEQREQKTLYLMAVEDLRKLQQALKKSQQESQLLQKITAGELEESKRTQQALQLLQETTTSELEKAKKLQLDNLTLYQSATAERNNREESYKALHESFKKAIAERDNVQTSNQNFTNENSALHAQIAAIHSSYSWRLTSGFRVIYYYFIKQPVRIFKKYLKKILEAIWFRLPISAAEKSRLKKRLFKNLPFIFCHFKSYRDWQTNNSSALNLEGRGSQVSEECQSDTASGSKNPYVPLNNEGVLTKLPVRLVAFYLPQFHEIPENNEWWGEGFTEWTNVRPAKPQFKGHYQPHVPGELGYYDLTDPAVQKRQVELAKQFGIGGFCFYFYWFSGKRLLEAPILNYLNDSSLDLPFCLCWANENWSRRWDGLENDVLIGQQHSAEDDYAFIEYVARYLRDPRNMQINGRPLLLVYRPSLLPSPVETAQRWRTWCRDNGIGEIYLVYTQSFEAEDPAKYGFDAAVEFPPNNSGPPEITEQAQELSPEFTGIVYDWRIFVERSKSYQQHDYTLFRSVTPSWDNTARRKTDGAIFANSSPEGYQAWLTRAVEDTLVNRENQDERLVFVNAWNEWAEGAYLEPDEKYGYAYLQSTRNALEHASNAIASKKNTIEDSDARRILLVIHDAYPHGAQYLILNMAKVLHESMGFIVEMIVLGEGPLIEEYSKYANVHELAGYNVQGKKTSELINQLSQQGISSAITNTAVTGLIVPLLKQNGFTVVSLIHELPQLIKDYQLEDHVKTIAREADKVVFAAAAVKDGFESFAKLDKTKVVMRPQGLYKKNSLQNDNEIKLAKQQLRKQFSLPVDAQIVLGVGFADYRKGIDIFVDAGIDALQSNKNIYFLWLGDFEKKIENKTKQSIKQSGFDKHFIFPGLDSNSDVYYAGADIYALTSREDPFPSVVLEAIDAVTPVVAFTESGGAGELISRGGGVLVDEMNAKDFSAALTELIESPEKAQQIGCDGKKIIDEEFSFRKYLFDLIVLADTGLQRVSVVVPNYNYEQYIRERLESIYSQRYPIYEIIILDDASSDSSVNVINNLNRNLDIDCKVIVNAENSGSVFKQWSKGVKLADGDFIWIAEADDLSDPEFLCEVMKGFDDASTVLSYCESKQMDSTGDILCDNYLDYVSDISRDKWRSNYKESGVDEITNCLAVKNTIPNVSAVVFNRNAISNVLEEKMDEIKQYKNAGDWVAYIYTLNHGGIAYSNKSLNNHRRHDSSVTISSFDIGQLEEILAVQKKVKELYVVDKDITIKANNYSQVLYEQFGLATENEPSIDKNSSLRSYL